MKSLRPKPPLEKHVQRAIMQFLALKYPKGMWWKNGNTLLAGTGEGKRLIPVASKGQSDIGGVLDGKYIEIEVKRNMPGSKLSKLQEDWQAGIRAAGGHTVVARSVEDVERFLEEVNHG